MLAEFALRSRILDITNIDVCVEMLNSNLTQNCFHVANKTAVAYELKASVKPRYSRVAALIAWMIFFFGRRYRRFGATLM